MVYFNDKAKCLKEFTANDVNLTMPETKIECNHILQQYLLEYETTLTVAIQFLAPTCLKLTPNITYSMDVVQRICLIFFDRSAFETVCNIVIRHNESLLFNEEPDFLLEKCLNRFSNDKLIKEDVLTGFIIDNHESFILYTESKSTTIITELWFISTTFSKDVMTCHYDSKLSFNYRLYKSFMSIGGILKIHLVFPIKHILKKTKFYLTGCVPLGCFNVRIHLINAKHLLLFVFTGAIKIKFLIYGQDSEVNESTTVVPNC